MNVNSVLNRFVSALAGGQKSFEERKAGGAKATGTIVFAANPTADDTITLGDTTLTFKASAAVGEPEVTIGVSLTATIDNIVTKIGTYATTSYIRQAAYTNTSGTTLTVTWNTFDTKGNAFTVASSSENGTVTAMSGGVDGTLDAAVGATIFTDSTAGAAQSFDLPAPPTGVVTRKTLVLAARSETQNVIVYAKGGNAMTLTFDAAKEYVDLVGYNGSWFNVGASATVA